LKEAGLRDSREVSRWRGVRHFWQNILPYSVAVGCCIINLVAHESFMFIVPIWLWFARFVRFSYRVAWRVTFGPPSSLIHPLDKARKADSNGSHFMGAGT
jgi:hypothetical protein